MNRTVRTAVMVLVVVVALMCGIAVITNAGIGVTAPEQVVVSNGTAGVNITWAITEDADGYIIYRKNADKGSADKIAKLESGEGNSYCDTEAQGGQAYIYTVKAYNGARKSKKSDPAEITYLSLPDFKYVTSGDGCVELAWSVSHGADGYTIYRKSDEKLVKLADVSGDLVCAYNDTLVKEDESYTYTVVAVKGDYRSAHVYGQSGVYIECPQLRRAENESGGVKLYWQETDTADEYVIYRKAEGENKWSKIAVTDDDSYSDETVLSGVKYTYTVRAAKESYYSGYNRMGVSTVYIKAPANIKAANYNKGIVLSWEPCQGASKYNVYRRNGDEWVLIGVCDTPRYYDDKIEDDEKYTYTVKAKNSKGNLSAFEKTAECRALNAPSNLHAESTSDGVKLTWAKKNWATGYIVYKKTAGSNEWTILSTLKNAKKTTVTDYDAKKGEEYTYTVRALKGDTYGCYNPEGTTVKHIPVSKITAGLTPNGINVTWTESVEKCDEYILYKAVGNSDDWKEIDTFKDDEFSYTDTKPAYGKLNKYKLTLMLDGGEQVDTAVAAVYGVDPNKPMVALTYDDGPNTKSTNRILDALEKAGARATFFIVGERLDDYTACIEREFALGCEIANHSYNHIMFNSADSKTVKNQITKTNNHVREITGKMPVLARAPGGDPGKNPKQDVAMPLIHWSLDTMDWSSRNADSVADKIKKNVKDGDIVLMHDLYDSTAAATEEIVPWLIAEGYQIVTVSEMMAVKGIEMEPGVTYHDAH